MPKILQKIASRAIVQELKDLDIALINSPPYYPQGKGKIERFFGTIQRQIICYIKERKVKNLEEAKEVLKELIDTYNNRYHQDIDTKPAEKVKKAVNVFRTIQPNEREMVENAFTERCQRKVNNVNEITYNGMTFKVPKFKGMPLANYTIEVRELPGYWIKLFYKNTCLAKYEIGQRKL